MQEMSLTQEILVKTPGQLRQERLQRREDEHCVLVMDMVHSRVPVYGLWSSAVFGRLPKYRQHYVRGYAQGALDMLAKEAGRPISKSITAPSPRIPKWVSRLQPGATWKHHPNGGGWVSHTATVASTAYIGPKCAAFDRARVLEFAELEGRAIACEDAELYGMAKAGGHSAVGGDARVGGAIHILGDVLVTEGLLVGDGVIRQQSDVERWTLQPGETPRRKSRGEEMLASMGVT